MSDISSIKVPEVETPYTVKDPNAVHLSGSNIAAADFMLNLQNNAGGAIKWPSGDMADLKRGWTAADGFTGAGVGADIPSIAAMIDAKMNTAAPVDAVTDGNMHAVTSNAVFDALQKAKIVHTTFSGQTDQSGNVEIMPYKNDYILIFASVNQNNYTCFGFFWHATRKFYAHVTRSTGAVADAGISVNGDAYFIKYENLEPIS